MALQTKYYKEIESHGHLWRLEILQDTENTLAPVEIGPVLQGLRLVMQGDQADIDTPIVKTSMEMTFVDAPDLEDNRKCGYWEEFYTSSATEYVVLLLKDGVHEWVGYITPDSFSEDLRYRGSVTIIARDGLGALQDYDFDAAGDSNGLITLYEIINKAWSVLPILSNWDSLSTERQSYLPYSVDGYSYIFAAKFNISALRGKTWWEVLEEALYATGMVLRFEGKKTFRVRALRQIGLNTSGYWMDNKILDVQFRAYGHRDLSPAVKNIKEEAVFDIQDNIIDSYTPGDAYGEQTTYTYGSSVSTQPNLTMPVHVITKGLFEGMAAENTIALNAFAYPAERGRNYGPGGEIHNPEILYIAANLVGGTFELAARKIAFDIYVPAGSYKISFDVNKAVALYQNGTTIGYADNISWWRYGYEAVFTGDDGSVKTLNNRSGTSTKEPEWQDGASSSGYHSISGDSFPVRVESPILQTAIGGTLTVRLRPADLPYSANGGYVGIANLALHAVDNAGHSIMETLRITTNYNSKNNIVLTRSPKFAPNPSTILAPRQIENNIYVGADEPIGSEQWVFKDDDTPQPLAVLIHQQMLAYYSKPNNMLTGELRDKEGIFPDFTSLWRWSGVYHLLTSGTLNILTGAIENATLREFKRYDHMWETWVEQENYEIDYSHSRSIILRVHTNKALTKTDVKNVPLWVTVTTVVEREPGLYYVLLSFDENDISYSRNALLKIDGAYVRIIQRAAGDYGIDYGKDYS